MITIETKAVAPLNIKSLSWDANERIFSNVSSAIVSTSVEIKYFFKTINWNQKSIVFCKRLLLPIEEGKLYSSKATWRPDLVIL